MLKRRKVEYDISSLHNVLLENQFMYIHLMWNKTAPSFIGGKSILLWITSWILQSKTIYYYDVSFPYGFEFDLIGQESWVHTLSITFHTTILLYLVLIKVLHHCFSRCFKSSQCYILDHIKTSRYNLLVTSNFARFLMHTLDHQYHLEYIFKIS